MNEVQEVFSNWLSKCLEERDMSQNELARKLDIMPSSVSKWICGRTFPTADKLQSLLDLFGYRIKFFPWRE